MHAKSEKKLLRKWCARLTNCRESRSIELLAKPTRPFFRWTYFWRFLPWIRPVSMDNFNIIRDNAPNGGDVIFLVKLMKELSSCRRFIIFSVTVGNENGRKVRQQENEWRPYCSQNEDKETNRQHAAPWNNGFWIMECFFIEKGGMGLLGNIGNGYFKCIAGRRISTVDVHESCCVVVKCLWRHGVLDWLNLTSSNFMKEMGINRHCYRLYYGSACGILFEPALLVVFCFCSFGALRRFSSSVRAWFY